MLCFHTMYSTHWPPWPVFCAVLTDNLLLNDLFPLCLETKPDWNERTLSRVDIVHACQLFSVQTQQTDSSARRLSAKPSGSIIASRRLKRLHGPVEGGEDVTARGGGHCEGHADVGLTTLVTNQRRVHGVLTTLTRSCWRGSYYIGDKPT